LAYWGLGVVLLMALRKKIQAPRIGLVNLSESARFQQFLTAMGLLGSSLVIFLLLIFKTSITQSHAELGNYYSLYFMIVLGLVPVILGIGGPKRFFLYEILFLTGLGLCLWKNYSLAWSYLVPGLIFCFIGGGMMYLFVKKHPKQPAESGA
jgi:hypothetical protein